jgi:hypothetical protein
VHEGLPFAEVGAPFFVIALFSNENEIAATLRRGQLNWLRRCRVVKVLFSSACGGGQEGYSDREQQLACLQHGNFHFWLAQGNTFCDWREAHFTSRISTTSRFAVPRFMTSSLPSCDRSKVGMSKLLKWVICFGGSPEIGWLQIFETPPSFLT